jgi:Na+/melibiose symporter-like transporter
MIEGQVGDPREQDYYGLVKLGYVTAVIVPVVGFILGVAVATRQSRAARHGVRIIVISLVSVAVFVVLIRTYEVNQANDQRMAAQTQALTQELCDAANAPITTLADLPAHISALNALVAAGSPRC